MLIFSVGGRTVFSSGVIVEDHGLLQVLLGGSIDREHFDHLVGSGVILLHLVLAVR